MTASLHSLSGDRLEEMAIAGDRSEDRLRLGELPGQGQLVLAADAEVRPALEEALAVELPIEPNHWHLGPPAAYWLAPGEWLIVGGHRSPEELEGELRAAAGDRWAAIVDVSDQRTILELTGPAAIEVLAGGCPIDLHPRTFRAGHCAQTLLGRAGVLIARGEQEDRYRLFVRRSFADYAASWLLDAIANLDPPPGLTR